jgi:hypothetical protein
MLNVLDRFTDSLGAPLRDFSRGRLAALLADPRPSTWEDAHGVVINAQGLTLWQAWIAIDETAPQTGRHVTLDPYDQVVVLEEWARIPDDQMLARAVAYALSVTEHPTTPPADDRVM